MAALLADLDAEQGRAVALAPMAGITDLPFRRLALGLGTPVVVSEMVASAEMVVGGVQARARAALGLGCAATVVQIAGRDPQVMAEAARRVADLGAGVIDINMGCPARKVTGGAAGSGLLRDPDRALRIIEAVAGAVAVPVTLKTRLGWDDDCATVAPLLDRAVAAGVARVTLHGRTRCAFYTGHADWAAVGRRTAGLAVPVLVNGDIDGVAAARAALAASGAAGVMVGRAARGRPWLPGQIAAALAGRPVPAAPTGGALVDLVAGHHAAMLAFYGRDLGLRVARKHLGWYADAAGVPAALRSALLTAGSEGEVHALLPRAFAASERHAA
ncbi:tRNA dihydrouridine synthase [Rhodobaculum claviforme]|uniref:tRNA dihydrouridine synthase n=1 Tax=Rhodobaculum claviforme TaxID=1549854 RepID=UPI003B84800F